MALGFLNHQQYIFSPRQLGQTKIASLNEPRKGTSYVSRDPYNAFSEDLFPHVLIRISENTFAMWSLPRKPQLCYGWSLCWKKYWSASLYILWTWPNQTTRWLCGCDNNRPSFRPKMRFVLPDEYGKNQIPAALHDDGCPRPKTSDLLLLENISTNPRNNKTGPFFHCSNGCKPWIPPSWIIIE